MAVINNGIMIMIIRNTNMETKSFQQKSHIVDLMFYVALVKIPSEYILRLKYKVTSFVPFFYILLLNGRKPYNITCVICITIL